MPTKLTYTDLISEINFEEAVKYLLNCSEHELLLMSNIVDALIEERDL